jgi:NADH-quinone oxidoreductase subunit A
VRPSNPDPVKGAAYECGVEAAGEARGRYSVAYYVIAVLFVVFDVEVIFLFPWAVRFEALGIFGLIEMVIFIAILVLGYLYAWKKGALEWV